MRRCLTEYQSATFARSSEHEAPLRKHVLDCSVALDQCLRPAQLATDLIPALFDEGFLVPSTMDPAPAVDVIDEVEPPSTAAWDRRPRAISGHPVRAPRSALAKTRGALGPSWAAVQRLHDESALTTSTAEQRQVLRRDCMLSRVGDALAGAKLGHCRLRWQREGVDAKSSCGLEAAASIKLRGFACARRSDGARPSWPVLRSTQDGRKAPTAKRLPTQLSIGSCDYRTRRSVYEAAVMSTIFAQ